ncbi:ferredoxin [Nocardia sp. NPDC050378]|uniref:ferredoxin n=1 Tax=Nocardia sp. NPDC050378 TaxID=3155400 RepID=UPI003407F9E6
MTPTVDPDVTVTVHPERCMGSGICRRAAPAVFGADNEGWVTLLDATPDRELVDGVLEASEECPTAAIDVELRQSSGGEAQGT